MKNALQFAAVMCVLLLAIGGFKVLWRNNHYNAQFEQNFMSNCTLSSAAVTCGCFYDQIQRNYTYREAVNLDERAKRGDVDRSLVVLANECR